MSSLDYQPTDLLVGEAQEILASIGFETVAKDIQCWTYQVNLGAAAVVPLNVPLNIHLVGVMLRSATSLLVSKSGMTTVPNNQWIGTGGDVAAYVQATASTAGMFTPTNFKMLAGEILFFYSPTTTYGFSIWVAVDA